MILSRSPDLPQALSLVLRVPGPIFVRQSKGVPVKIVLFLVVALVLSALLWVRLSPNDSAAWNTDPLTATRTTQGGWLVRPQGGDAAATPVAMPAAEMLAILDRIALDTPRTTRLSGSVAEGRITYITRSALLGFPDFTTVSAIALPDGTQPVLFARQRFGDGDMGVNRARVEDWLARLATALAP